jgi:hypothetical protein
MNQYIENPLFEAVCTQLQCDDALEFINTCRDINRNGGAQDGYSGFIYYSETIKFARENMDLILQELKEEARDCEASVSELVATFRCLDVDLITGCHPQDFEEQFWRVVHDKAHIEDAETSILNALAWWALEHVAFRVECLAEYEDHEARRAS